MNLQRKRSPWKGMVLTLGGFLILIALFASMLGQAGQRADSEQATLLENAIRNAAVSNYATEGRYPDTLDKIVQQYGVVIDEQRFHVRYDIFADNIMPDITVTLIKGEGDE